MRKHKGRQEVLGQEHMLYPAAPGELQGQAFETAKKKMYEVLLTPSLGVIGATYSLEPEG